VRRSIWVTVAIFVVCLSMTPEIKAQTQGWEEIFFRANQAYKGGHFQEAVDGYSKLIRFGHGQGQGELYYNLGNAYFRLHQLGRAILNYERAHLLIPRDEDLKYNLGYAREKTQDAVPKSQGFIGMTFFWLGSLSLSEVFWGFGILNMLFWGVLLIRLIFHSEWTYYLSLVLLVSWLIVCISFGLKWYQTETDDRAVILKPEVSILAGPDIRDTVLFKLHEGTTAHLERSEDGWSLIHLSEQKRGWIKKEDLERINP